MKKHDLVEEAKRRIAEEARRRAAEKAREEARLKAEEDACAVAEYYASLGYRVRLKTQASKMGELIFEPTNAAATLTEAVEALEGAITGGAEEEAAIADGLLMSDEEIAARTADGDMPALDEILGKRYLKADGGQRGRARFRALFQRGERSGARRLRNRAHGADGGGKLDKRDKPDKRDKFDGGYRFGGRGQIRFFGALWKIGKSLRKRRQKRTLRGVTPRRLLPVSRRRVRLRPPMTRPL